MIGDNIVYAYEILHQVRLTKQKGIIFKLAFEKIIDNVHWDILPEVLLARGFRPLFINWVHDIFMGDRICISFNGEHGVYFSCERGIKHGEFMSHFLFDLVADALNKILSKA